MEKRDAKDIERRTFLKAAAATAGMAILPAAAAKAAEADD